VIKKTFKEKYGPWAVVTGASSGIGFEFAHQLAALGLNLVLVARRKDRLDLLAIELHKKYAIQCKVIQVDLSQNNFLTEIEKVTAEIEIGLLINNAGFGTTGELLENDLETEIKLLHVNCRAPLILAHHFGNKMKDRKKGGIIFTASIVGFTAVPLWSNYAASKAYDLFLSEALSHELKPHGVDVLALCPGTTKAEFQEIAGTQMLMPMSAEAVVQRGLQKLGHTYVTIPGILNRLNVLSVKLLPQTWSTRMFGRIIRTIRKTPGF